MYPIRYGKARVMFLSIGDNNPIFEMNPIFEVYQN
jgi:hypothetical protein